MWLHTVPLYLYVYFMYILIDNMQKTFIGSCIHNDKKCQICSRSFQTEWIGVRVFKVFSKKAEAVYFHCGKGFYSVFLRKVKRDISIGVRIVALLVKMAVFSL